MKHSYIILSFIYYINLQKMTVQNKIFFLENFSERNIEELKKEIKNVKIKTNIKNLKCPYCGSKHVYIHSYKNILLKNRVFDDKI